VERKRGSFDMAVHMWECVTEREREREREKVARGWS